MIKKALGGALAALLITSATAATAAQPIRAAGATVSGVKSGIRAGTVKKGDNAAVGGIGGLVIIAGFVGIAAFVGIKAADYANDDNDSPE